MAVSTSKKSKNYKKNKKSKVVLFDEEIVTKDKAEKILSEARIKEDEKLTENIEKKSRKKKHKPENENIKEQNSFENIDGIEASLETKIKKNKKRKQKNSDQKASTTTEPKKKKKKKQDDTPAGVDDNDNKEPVLKKKKRNADEPEAGETAVNEEEQTELDPSKPEIKKKESIRERKRKKHQKLLEEKKLKTELSLQQKSLNYLSKWKHSRNEWKFEKLRQIWLQQNMFDSSKLPETFWQTLVDYFNSSKGKARTQIMKDALKVIETEESNTNNLEDEEKEYQIKVQRARDIIQGLQE